MATKKPMKKPVKRVRRFQEGGEAALKAEGLAASNKDAPLGFFESLRRLGQGNIDQEGSEAYNRYGAGRGRMERDAASELAANRMVDAINASRSAENANAGVAQNVLIANAQGAREMDEEMYQRGRRASAVVDSADRNQDYTPIVNPAAAAQNAAILAAKPSRKTTGDFTRLDRKALLPSGPNVKFAPGGAGKRRSASAEELAASLAAAPRNGASAIPGPTASQAAANASSGGERLPEVTGMSNLEKLIAGTGIAGGALGIATKGKKIIQAGKKAFQNFRSAKDAAKKSPPSGATGVMPSKYIYTGAKKGGMVKKMAHGGSVKSTVSTASKRGDGIALRGKTRGKIY